MASNSPLSECYLHCRQLVFPVALMDMWETQAQPHWGPSLAHHLPALLPTCQPHECFQTRYTQRVEQDSTHLAYWCICSWTHRSPLTSFPAPPMQKWTGKLRYVEDCIPSSANAFRKKLNLVVSSQLPIGNVTARRAGATQELVTAALHASTSQSSERPVPFWDTAVGPSKVYTRKEVIQPSSLTVPPELCSLPTSSLSTD